MLLKELAERERLHQRAAQLRAGVIAATIYNVRRKKGSRALQASDFFPEPGPARRMTPREAMAFMDGWMRQQNQSAKVS